VARRTVRSGFTLLELILVIGIVSVLVALLAPSLGRSLDGARRTKTLSYLGQHGRVFGVYAADWNDCYPAFLDPDATEHIIRHGHGQVEIVPLYFLAHAVWPYALADGYYGGNPRAPEFYPAEQSARFGVGGTPLAMSCSLFARPEFWSITERTCAGQLGATRVSEVLHPAKKAVLVNVYAVHTDAANVPISGRPISGRSPVPVLTSDGSGQDRQVRDYRAGVTSGEAPCPSLVHPWDVWVGMHTDGGVRGRDLR
jgi:prepilin-type N-terminal cleavage/methylation domain-containing protein